MRVGRVIHDLCRYACLGAISVTAGACSASSDGAIDESTSASTEADLFSHYAAVVRAAGGTVNPHGEATVLGLRRARPSGGGDGARTLAVFDDAFVVLTADHRVIELVGSTHPWFTRSNLSVDADGDGVPDVAMIRPGLYQVVGRGASRNIGGLPTYHVLLSSGSDKLPAWRDTRHDGSFDAAERAASEARGDTATAILFHLGGLSAVPAIGCQVFSEPALRQLVAAVGGPQAHFNYVLVDATSSSTERESDGGTR